MAYNYFNKITLILKKILSMVRSNCGLSGMLMRKMRCILKVRQVLVLIYLRTHLFFFLFFFSAADEENLNERNTHTPKGFVPLYSITQAVGLLSIILILYWIFAFNKGFSLSTPISEFNWHPFLMSLGMIYLTGNGQLIYEITKKKINK